MTPASAPRWRVAKARRGVGRGRARRSAQPPAAVTTAAVSRAKTAEPCRASKPTTTVGAGVGVGVPLRPPACRYATSPAAARITTARFMRFGPAPRMPRSPAVPNWSMPAKRSARSSAALVLPPRAASITAARSSRIAGSGSSASQASRVPGGRPDPLRSACAGPPWHGGLVVRRHREVSRIPGAVTGPTGLASPADAALAGALAVNATPCMEERNGGQARASNDRILLDEVPGGRVLAFAVCSSAFLTAHRAGC